LVFEKYKISLHNTHNKIQGISKSCFDYVLFLFLDNLSTKKINHW